MKSQTEIHEEQKRYSWRFRVAYGEGYAVMYGNGFSLEDNIIMCSSLRFDIQPIEIMGRRLDEAGFIRKLRVGYMENSCGFTILEEEEGGSRDNFGTLDEYGNLEKSETLYATTSYDVPIGISLNLVVKHECVFPKPFMLEKDDQICVDYETPTSPSDFKSNLIMGDIFDKKSLQHRGPNLEFLEILRHSIPIILVDKASPSGHGSGGVIVNKYGLIVGMLTVGSDPYGVAIHVSAIRACVDLYKELRVNRTKTEDDKGKKREVIEHEYRYTKRLKKFEESNEYKDAQRNSQKEGSSKSGDVSLNTLLFPPAVLAELVPWCHFLDYFCFLEACTSGPVSKEQANNFFLPVGKFILEGDALKILLALKKLIGVCKRFKDYAGLFETSLLDVTLLLTTDESYRHPLTLLCRMIFFK